LNYIVRHASGK
jgi:hypothetical protein